jgi:hypothetical protein
MTSQNSTQEDIVTFLMAAGCKKQLTNEDGEMPLALATHNQAAEIQVLLQTGQANGTNQSTGQDKASDSERQ